MRIIYRYVLLIIMVSGFTSIDNVLTQEDVVEIEDKPIPFD